MTHWDWSSGREGQVRPWGGLCKCMAELPVRRGEAGMEQLLGGAGDEAIPQTCPTIPSFYCHLINEKWLWSMTYTNRDLNRWCGDPISKVGDRPGSADADSPDPSSD